MSQSEAVDQFRAITSLDTETCRAFLEAANWNVEVPFGPACAYMSGSAVSAWLD